MNAFEDWLAGLPSPALKLLAGGGASLRPLHKPEVLELIRRDPELARESWRIKCESEAWVASQDPKVLRGLKIKYGLVD